MKNINLVLPVVELRLDKFGGTDTSLSRVNLHVIFADDISADIIEQQFIAALACSYQLTPDVGNQGASWKRVLSRTALEDLGTQIIESVTEQERKRFGSPIAEGFNNLNVSLDAVLNVLNSHYFRNRHLLAVGKTEWWNIKWNDKSIAEKKNIINRAHIVFQAARSPTEYDKARNSLIKAEVNSMLFDCSDAHWFSSASEKDRIGNCFTWIKADPTFRGLKHVLIEPEERVYVGESPPEISTVKENRTRYIESISIHKIAKKREDLSEKWFDCDIPINAGLVAVIGNKGSGKSAFVDILGLLGNSRTEAAWSFLASDKFRKLPDNKTLHFKGTLTWADGKPCSSVLDKSVSDEAVERVKYIPQNYFEQICNQLPSAEESSFDHELKSVIFSHVSEANRLDKTSRDELIDFRSGQIDHSIARARERLSTVNRKIAQLEQRLLPPYRKALENKLNALQLELESASDNRPKSVKKPAGVPSSSPQLKAAEKKIAGLRADLKKAQKASKGQANRLASIERILGTLENLQIEVERVTEEVGGDLAAVGIQLADIMKFEVNVVPLNTLYRNLNRQKSRIDKTLDSRNPKGLPNRIDNVDENIQALRKNLGRPSRIYKDYRDRLAAWQKRKKQIIGDHKTPDTIKFVESQIANIEKTPAQLLDLYKERRQRAASVYKSLAQKRKLLTELYSPVQTFINEHPDIGQRIDIKFGVSISNVEFEEQFLQWINLAKSGAFMGLGESREVVRTIVETYDYGTEHGAIAFADEIMRRLLEGPSGENGCPADISAQLRKGKTVASLYDFLYSFEYLQPHYVLLLGEKELRQLSPGERGALLIVFYLLVDKDTTPFVVDQPEHNLDNETVTRLLVPAIKRAKRKRQIVLVTHNPILAVVCNADQIITADLDIKKEYQVEYTPGALENPAINKRIVDILEGTMPAFDNRNRKYIRDYLEGGS